MENDIKLNTIPALTWNWLKSNNAILEDELKTEIDFSECKYEIVSCPDGVNISVSESSDNCDNAKINTNLSSPKSAVLDMPKDTGIQYKPLSEEKMNGNSGSFGKAESKSIIIETSGKITEPVVINFKAEGRTYTNQIIHALPGSEISVILLSESQTDSGIDFIRTKCFAEENAKINLYKVQLLGNGFYRIDSTESVCGENANVNFTELQLGAASVYTGAYTSLEGYKSSYNSDTAYFRHNSQKIDMNYVCCHKGKKTECKMAVAGSLKDEAEKTYRGTIDFKRGCASSKGNETEETLLLSKKVVNKSVPIILCDEEDVEGEHGATIGRLSEDVLFYMNAHGISEEEAEKIMSKAKVQAVLVKIPSEKIREKVSEFMGKIFE